MKVLRLGMPKKMIFVFLGKVRLSFSVWWLYMKLAAIIGKPQMKKLQIS